MDIGAFLTALVPLIAVVWAATEALGRMLTWRKDRIALLLGPATTLVAYLAGWLPAPCTEGIWCYVGVGLIGLLATLAAGVANDYIVAAVKKPTL